MSRVLITAALVGACFQACAPDSDDSLAGEIGAYPINLSGGASDGRAKSGYMLRIAEGQGSEETLRKAARMKTLVTVDLCGKQVTNDWLAPLEGHTYIGSIKLTSTSIGDDGLKFLALSSGLKWLTLIDTPVTDAGVSALRAAVPSCKIRVNVGP